MPKASVNEDNLSAPDEHQVWFAGKFRNINPKFVSAQPDYFSNEKLRLSVFTADERHSATALGLGERVHGPFPKVHRTADPWM